MDNRERIVILGAGESGTGAAILARQKGYDVFVSDAGKIKPFYREMLDDYHIIYESGGHTERMILNATEVIKSPGIPESVPIVKAIRKKGIRVISEIEFAGRYTSAKKICITGSNGKTTTTSLIHHMMRKAGLNVGMAGNVGRSFAYQVATEAYDYFVLELSSFQL
ncbi:MAG TPA: UDP-N-acetylmuramoyl-L-alanine--D-glutamate ligase, partial [Bacteroides sp.]|nr:UDP-N-acetylmuramoyl-L-alanine--D-glutamate ligase [Bacteroides sp.]